MSGRREGEKEGVSEGGWEGGVCVSERREGGEGYE